MSVLLLERVELLQGLNDRSYITIDRPVMRYRMFPLRLRRVKVVGQLVHRGI